MSPVLLDMVLGGNIEVILKHALALQSTNGALPPLPEPIYAALFTGKLDKTALVNAYVDNIVGGCKSL